MDERDRKIAEAFKSLVAQRVKIHEMLVFGSRARGDATQESDLDVFIVVDRLDYSIEKHISDSAWEAGFREGVVVVPVAVSIETREHSPFRESAFAKNVSADGVIL